MASPAQKHIVRTRNQPTGGGVIYDFTIIALGRVIGPNTRFIDTRV